jgi:hypothetical protein
VRIGNTTMTVRILEDDEEDPVFGGLGGAGV